MKLSITDLQLIESAIELALDELHNRKATCPDLAYFASDVEEIVRLEMQFDTLLQRVRKSLERSSV